jgi:hypothetical protein
MIDFVSVCAGCIELYSGEELVGTYRSPGMIADVIRENGGPAPVIYRSSDWDDAVYFGFDSQEELEGIWKRVCDYL